MANVQKIEMRKYGKFLHGREDGLRAYTIINNEIQQTAKDTKFFFDFDKVLALAPSYCDEVFGRLQSEIDPTGKSDKLIIDKNMNEAFFVSFETVEETRGVKFHYGIIN